VCSEQSGVEAGCTVAESHQQQLGSQVGILRAENGVLSAGTIVCTNGQKGSCIPMIGRLCCQCDGELSGV
jgi:hypothetical protein